MGIKYNKIITKLQNRPRLLSHASSGRTQRWRIVGRPWGQFHGDCRLDRLLTTRRMVPRVKCLPIMMEERQAREARTLRTREGRGTRDPGRGIEGSVSSRPISSSTSAAPNTTPLLHMDRVWQE